MKRLLVAVDEEKAAVETKSDPVRRCPSTGFDWLLHVDLCSTLFCMDVPRFMVVEKRDLAGRS